MFSPIQPGCFNDSVLMEELINGKTVVLVGLQQKTGIPQLGGVDFIGFAANWSMRHQLSIGKPDNRQYTIVIIQMDALACQNCSSLSSQFTILTCDHIVCAECLWAEVKASLHGLNSIRCNCGVITKFPSSPTAYSNNITVATSPRKPPPRNIRTEGAAFSVRSPSSPTSSRGGGREGGRGELQGELEFLGVQFRKSVEEAERSFRRVVESITGRFTNLVKNIRMFWFEEVLESRSLALLQLPKLLAKKYHKSVGASLEKLNEGFLEQLAAFRMETQPGERGSSWCRHHQLQRNKENSMNTRVEERRMEEKRKLLSRLEEMREGCGIRKGSRKVKPTFNRI